MRNKSKTSKKRGFSLVELLITTSIFVIITTVVLVKNTAFNSSVLLSNLAYETALSIRQAQVFGLSVRGFETGFDIGYGVHFDRDVKDTFIFFADIPRGSPPARDQKYNVAGGELVEAYKITRGNKIAKFCVQGSSAENCTSGPFSISELDIVFTRPNPEAVISTDRSGVFGVAKIYLESPNGEQRMVVVESTGQISVQNP